MGTEKQSSKGFFHLFDWNAKSRKKLFSSNSDLPEKSKQKKRFDGNLPVTRLQMMDEDEVAAGSSIRGGSDYSCASSVTDGDFYESKAPGVVARLMGLDSLPKSAPLFDSQSLPDFYCQCYSNEYHQDPQIMHHDTISRYQKVISRPIEKFQTEILPPKSAKSIPITHHKLLSPIKSANSIPPKDAAHIMEAAARIIEPRPQSGSRRKLSSSSVALKVKDLKEKVEAAQKPLKLSEDSQGRCESNAVKNVRGHSRNKSWNDSNSIGSSSSVSIFGDSEDSSVCVRGKGRSISLALQAKANVQKREALNTKSSGILVGQKETNELSPNQLKKPTTQNGSRVLRHNSQKQNASVDRARLPLKSNLEGGKAKNGDFSSTRQGNSSKPVGASKVGSRKLGSEIKYDKKQVPSSSSGRVTSKKRSIDGNYHSERDHQAVHDPQKDKTGKAFQSSDDMDWQNSQHQDSGQPGTDVISFTFTAPITKSRPGSGGSTEAGENCKIFRADSPRKRTLLNSDGRGAPKFSFLGHNIKGGDTLSTFLEQQLKELTHKVEFSQQKSGRVSLMSEENESTGQKCQGLVEEMGISGRNIFEDRMLIDYRLPSPVSVLQHSFFAESCNSWETIDSNNCLGGGKLFSSVQFQDVLRSYSANTSERDVELLDSASSTSAGTLVKQQQTTLTLPYCGKQRGWELEYVKELVLNIELTFKDYALGKASEIINPHLFYQLESWKGHFNVSRINTRLMFDCVSECLDLRCRKYVGGGYNLWAKGIEMVKRKDRLAEEIYKDISGWSAMGDFMVDELVDNDMGSQHGRWLDYEVEAFELGVQIETRILNSLIDEVVADILVL